MRCKGMDKYTISCIYQAPATTSNHPTIQPTFIQPTSNQHPSNHPPANPHGVQSNARRGDKVEFHFYPSTHSVA